MRDHQLNPDSLETIEIEVPERQPVRFNYEPLSISSDLCVVSLEAAVRQLGNPQVSCDLWVSTLLAQHRVAEEVLARLPDNYIVNRVRVNAAFHPHEWMVECGDGSCVGSDPA